MGKYSVHDLYIGQLIEKKFTVSEAMGLSYANISQDYNPIHLDLEFARTSRFGEKIVHGMLIGSFISGIIGNEFPGAGSVYISQEIVFKRPVHYNIEIVIRVEVMEINLEKKHVLLVTQCYDTNNRLLVDGKAKILLEE